MRNLLPFLLFAACDPATTFDRAIDDAHAQPNTERHTSPDKVEQKRPTTLEVKDLGVLGRFDDEVTIRFPSWLHAASTTSGGISGKTAFAFVDATAIGLAAKPDVTLANFDGDDADGDGIPNQLDILLGAKKADLNDAAYGSPYRTLDYPGGDVPEEEGVCTDVIIRAVRNAGIDLQRELHLDIKRSPKSFPMVKSPDPNIDQRRVKTMLPYFERQWVSLPTSFKGNETTWFPGDIVFMQTMGDKRPDHVGIVSDRVGESGAPLIINNWTNGSRTDELDLVEWVPITHRFRWRSKTRFPAAWSGLDGVLKQASLSIPLNAKQAIVVTSGATDATRGELRLLEKSDAGWAIRLGPFDVALGSKGMRRGVDIVPNDIAPQKKEGDLTSPWGVFAIGSAFGTKPKKKAWTWRYRAVQSDDVWVDDPQSKFYNTWQKNGGAWRSAEALTQYDRALVIEHNTTFPRAGAGSAIFLHSWSDVDQPTLGCTALRQKDLDKVLGLLTEKRHPVFVQAPVWWIAPAKN